MSYRDCIVYSARQLLGGVSDHPSDLKGGERKGWELLKNIIDEAFEGKWSWTPENLKALKTPGMRLRLDGRGGVPARPGAEGGLHWCGIFATYCLRSAGMPVKWRANLGITPSDRNSAFVWKYRSFVPSDKFDVKSLEPGDVAGIPASSHHFIVVNSTHPDYVDCIAGNGSYQRIEAQRHLRKNINVYYKIASEIGNLRS